MDFEFSAEQEALRDSVRRFLAARAPLAWVREQQENNRGVTDDVWNGLRDLGVLDLPSMVDAGVVLEELGRVAFPGPFAASAVGARFLAGSCGEGDHAAAIADGSLIATVALDEPGLRFAWHEPAMAADGAGRLTGVKTAVDGAVAAGLVYVTATGPQGFALYAVETAGEGVRIDMEPTVDITHRRGAMHLDGAAGALVAKGDDAIRLVAAAVDRLAVAMMADGVGAASQALAIAVEYARERTQFGRPIGSFQAVQHMCAQMLQTVELARAGVYYALWALDAADAAEAHRAATMAKAFASDGLPRVGADTIQVFGGIGFTWEHDAHLYFKRLLTMQHAYGSAADHLEALARIVL